MKASWTHKITKSPGQVRIHRVIFSSVWTGEYFFIETRAKNNWRFPLMEKMFLLFSPTGFSLTTIHGLVNRLIGWSLSMIDGDRQMVIGLFVMMTSQMVLCYKPSGAVRLGWSTTSTTAWIVIKYTSNIHIVRKSIQRTSVIWFLVQLLDGLSWNMVQIFMFPSGRTKTFGHSQTSSQKILMFLFLIQYLSLWPNKYKITLTFQSISSVLSNFDKR